MHPTWPIVAIGIAFGLTLVALLLVVVFARYGVEGPEHPLKRNRYEAGNPPKGSARIAVPPQYYGYALVFLVVDTVFSLLYLMGFVSKASLVWTIIATILIAPPLAYALRYSKDIHQWT